MQFTRTLINGLTGGGGGDSGGAAGGGGVGLIHSTTASTLRLIVNLKPFQHSSHQLIHNYTQSFNYHQQVSERVIIIVVLT